MSKFVINHITQYRKEDFEEIAHIYLQENMNESDFDKKEDLPEILSDIYIKAKELIKESTEVDVLKTSSFCSFLREFNFLTKKHLEVRKNLQDSFNKIFENHKQVDEIIEEALLRIGGEPQIGKEVQSARRSKPTSPFPIQVLRFLLSK